MPGVRGPAHTPTTPVEAIEPFSPSCSNQSSSRSATDIVKMRTRSWTSRRPSPAARAPSRSSDEQVGRVARPERRRLAQHHRAQERGGAVEQVLEALVDLAVAFRERRDRGGGARRLVEEEDRPLGCERRIRGVERDRAIAVVAQPQVRDDLRLQHRDDVGGARDPRPRPDLLGDAGAAEDRRGARASRPAGRRGPGRRRWSGRCGRRRRRSRRSGEARLHGRGRWEG